MTQNVELELKGLTNVLLTSRLHPSDSSFSKIEVLFFVVEGDANTIQPYIQCSQVENDKMCWTICGLLLDFTDSSTHIFTQKLLVIKPQNEMLIVWCFHDKNYADEREELSIMIFICESGDDQSWFIEVIARKVGKMKPLPHCHTATAVELARQNWSWTWDNVTIITRKLTIWLPSDSKRLLKIKIFVYSLALVKNKLLQNKNCD